MVSHNGKQTGKKTTRLCKFTRFLTLIDLVVQESCTHVPIFICSLILSEVAMVNLEVLIKDNHIAKRYVQLRLPKRKRCQCKRSAIRDHDEVVEALGGK